MNTVDSILPHIRQHISTIEHLIPKKDARILLSLADQVSSDIFLTESQGNLLVKIIKENISAIRSVFQDIDSTLTLNQWSSDFRIAQKVRKIWVEDSGDPQFVVEFSSNSRLKEKLSGITSQIERTVHRKENRYYIHLNERNIDLVVGAFIKDDFDIAPELLSRYNEIKQIKNQNLDPFDIFSTNQTNLKTSVMADIQSLAPENILKIYDRRIRYQYTINHPIDATTLAAKIATRPDRRIRINESTIPVIELLRALKELDRFPALLVFEGRSAKRDKRQLDELTSALSSLCLEGTVGIYFRYDGNDDTVNFNQTIKNLEYNKPLSATTVVAGISNYSLPKFMIKMQWKPQAVISFTNSFKSNKASVYCNDVDLVIYYTNTPPLGEKIYEIL